MNEPEENMVTTPTGAVRSCHYSGGVGRPEKNRLDLLFLNREGLETLAEAFARGMKKYGRTNWQKGFDESVLVQHALDHLIHYVNGTCDPGEEDVDQLSGVLWNIFTLCWVRKHKPELLDLTGPDPGPEDQMRFYSNHYIEPPSMEEERLRAKQVNPDVQAPTWMTKDLEAFYNQRFPGVMPYINAAMREFEAMKQRARSA